MTKPAPISAEGRASRFPVVRPAQFRRLSIASLVTVSAIVLTGAAVRLTGSGLGCPDWPSCYQRRLTLPVSFHGRIEFGNRLVTVLVTLIVAFTLLAALRRRPYRIDLAWLSGGLVGGVLAQAGLGGIVVYTKLNPYLVMVHFLLSMLLVANATVLVHRSNRNFEGGSGTLLVPRPILFLSRGMLALLAFVISAGTATTGAGPHAGDAAGHLVAKRIPIALRQMAELHSSLALLLCGLVISLAITLHTIDVPERVRRSVRVLTVVLVAQAGVGYAQYFSHLPTMLVEVHILGATLLTIGAVHYFLALNHHPFEDFDRSRTKASNQAEAALLEDPTPESAAFAS